MAISSQPALFKPLFIAYSSTGQTVLVCQRAAFPGHLPVGIPFATLTVLQASRLVPVSMPCRVRAACLPGAADLSMAGDLQASLRCYES